MDDWSGIWPECACGLLRGVDWLKRKSASGAYASFAFLGSE